MRPGAARADLELVLAYKLSVAAPLKVSPDIARRLALSAQGLDQSEAFGRGQAGALAALRHLGYVQIDTIAVVERAHHQVLWSRVPTYQPRHLQELQVQTREIFEYWSHAASFLPMEDYRFCLPRMQAHAAGQRHWFKRQLALMSEVLERIRKEGPLQAKDFEAPTGKKSGPWFDWKPAKKALEQLFMEGRLMVRERRGFQKVYDLPERVLPAHISREPPTQDEWARHLVERGLRAHGLVTAAEVKYLRTALKDSVTRVLHQMEEEKRVLRVDLQGEIHHCEVKILDQAFRRPPAEMRILSPFDNLLIQRKRVKKLFDFDFQIECYLPEAKRRYGYFCHALLWKDRLVGRLDAKADRARKILEVKSIHWELKGRELRAAQEGLHVALEKFALFNGCVKLAGLGRSPKPQDLSL